MKTLRVAFRRTAGLFTHRRQDAEFAAEISSHLALHIDDGIRAGLTPAEARRRAMVRLGGLEPVRESYRDRSGVPIVEGLLRDIRYGLRALRKEPRFTLIAILTLALGVGANTAVFSVVHAVLLRPLPYPKPDRLVRIARQIDHGSVNIAEYQFAKDHSQPFVSVAAHAPVGDRSLGSGRELEWIGVMPVSAAFFETLGVAPERGREFNAGEVKPNGPPAVILTQPVWRRLFGADPAIVGRAVTMDEAPFTVIGILPASFWFPDHPEAFVPLRSAGPLADQGANSNVLARLKDDVTLEQAQTALATSSQALVRNRPAGIPNGYRGLTAVSWHDDLTGDVRPKLLVLAAAVAGLLLIACANLAGLLLARLAARQKEVAVRLALGCSRARLLRQLVIENLLLGMAGGSLGLLAAWWSLDGLVALIPFSLPARGAIRMDWPVLAGALAVALAASLIISLTPFLASSHIRLRDTLQTSGRSTGSGQISQRMRGALVITEIGLSVTLLVAAALLIQSLYRLHRERLGFEPHGVITFWTPATPERRANPARLRAFEAQILERLRTIPGVRSAATVNMLPLTSQGNLPAEPVGHPERAIGGTELRVISPGYFATLGIPIVAGRAPGGLDNGTAPPVILVNETLARAWWPDGTALGGRVAVGRFHGTDYANGHEPQRAVIGIAADTKSVYLKQRPRPTVYLPAAQTLWYDRPMNWAVRADPALSNSIRRAIAEIDPRQRIERLRTMDAIVASTTADSRFDAWLFGAFAALALLLSAIGVYGLLSFSVALRTSEIGTRMALGASRVQVLKLVLRQGIILTATGLAAGLAGALLLTRSLQSMLFGVRATDPLTFAAVSAALLSTGLLASYLPARRATRVDPMTALRCD